MSSLVHAGLDESRQQPVPTMAGSLLHFAGVHSRFLSHPHDVTVMLPPEYDEHPDQRYPVLYLHDGQNVFDDLPMSPFGVQWGVDTTARALIHARVIEPIIIVAIGNAGRDRIDEYTPTRDSMHDAVAMPIGMDRCWCTRSNRGWTGNGAHVGSARHRAAGSSGRAVTLHLGLTHPAVFGKLDC